MVLKLRALSYFNTIAYKKSGLSGLSLVYMECALEANIYDEMNQNTCLLFFISHQFASQYFGVSYFGVRIGFSLFGDFSVKKKQETQILKSDGMKNVTLILDGRNYFNK